ncbi:MAG: 5-dehydro-4-deoxy-D-glucuronate isomerase [Candidatus Marinimicrobia bacterium]|nr:5-dehydro-4-deoxy-D-glucuronate isomerase [Candidatus Neomarinimicrobiota bacterium]
MKVHYLPDPISYSRMDTCDLRKAFLVDKLFIKDEINLLYTMADRAIVGSAVPVKKSLGLEDNIKELAVDFFAERREMGIINIGAAGVITVDGKEFPMDTYDTLYVGRGTQSVEFNSIAKKSSAKYYILSYPAHYVYPVKHVKFKNGNSTTLGSTTQANKRTITKLIYPGGVGSCQLVMGITRLQTGSVWNTMIAHTHPRRTEIYLYFNLAQDQRIFHIFGKPDETRHLVMKNQQAVISPAWSLHSGVGTADYSFIWGMGGENQAFDDMDFIPMDKLR